MQMSAAQIKSFFFFIFLPFSTTTGGRLFTVFYGVVGVPITVIFLSNFGLYMRRVEERARFLILRCWRSRYSSARKRHLHFDTMSISGATGVSSSGACSSGGGGGSVGNEGVGVLSPLSLASIVAAYLGIGAILMPLLDGRFEPGTNVYYFNKKMQRATAKFKEESNINVSMTIS